MNRHDAYLALLDRHRPVVWRMCWLRARGDWERCRDLVQEVSIALWLHFDKLRPDATPGEERAWVRWLTRSTLDHLHRSPSPTLLPLTAELEASLKAESPHDEDLEEVLSSLNADDQQLMRLHLEGYRADEIAEHMGLQRDAVYQRMHRALAKARRAIAVLLMLVGASALAIALVPQWRTAVFHTEPPAAEPAEVVVEPVEPPESPSAVLEEEPLSEGMSADTPAVQPRALLEPLPPIPLESLVGSLAEQHEPPPPPPREDVIVYVHGKSLTVKGPKDEFIRVYNERGVLVAAKRCRGRCTIENFAAPHPDDIRRYAVQIGSNPNRRIGVEL